MRGRLVAQLLAAAGTPAAAGGYANPELLVSTQELAGRIGDPSVRVVDVGRDERSAACRAGHVPGAVNLEWSASLNPDGTFKSADALRALFEAAGVRLDRQVIVHCQSGTRASHDYFALRLPGYARVANYDGSWNEWGNDPSRPVAR